METEQRQRKERKEGDIVSGGNELQRLVPGRSFSSLYLHLPRLWVYLEVSQ